MAYLIDQSREIVIRSKNIKPITKFSTKSNAFKIVSTAKDKIIIKTDLDICSIIQLLPKNSEVQSIAKEPNLADLFK